MGEEGVGAWQTSFGWQEFSAGVKTCGGGVEGASTEAPSAVNWKDRAETDLVIFPLTSPRHPWLPMGPTAPLEINLLIQRRQEERWKDIFEREGKFKG